MFKVIIVDTLNKLLVNVMYFTNDKVAKEFIAQYNDNTTFRAELSSMYEGVNNA